MISTIGSDTLIHGGVEIRDGPQFPFIIEINSKKRIFMGLFSKDN